VSFFFEEKQQQQQQHRLDGGKSVELVHAFGRELPEMSSEMPPFDLAVHCGGCLIDS
jgi:hypothetical protein